MTKYPITKEFFPFNLFAPPMSRKFVLLAKETQIKSRYAQASIAGIIVESGNFFYYRYLTFVYC